MAPLGCDAVVMAALDLDASDATMTRLLALYDDPAGEKVRPREAKWDVSASLREEYAERGHEQWLYGEVTGHRELLEALLAVPALSEREELVVDIGSGTGRFVVYAALAGCHACGQEFVPERHAAAVAARARCSPEEQARLELRCEDALATTSALEVATRVFCNNAVWPDTLNATVAAHVVSCAPRLVVFATMKELSLEAARATGLVLTRRTAVEVSWDRTGWPLYLYEPRDGPDSDACPEPLDDEAFHAAHESSSGFSMF